ncbi:hypothetical protein CBS101457_006043 [Exobasidium rhododendri]|nr:hypothetical protein CBS101457_006043 [Exobasidium rhododendri]
MVDDQRTAESFYSSSPWLSTIPAISREPFEKMFKFSLNLANDDERFVSPTSHDAPRLEEQYQSEESDSFTASTPSFVSLSLPVSSDNTTHTAPMPPLPSSSSLPSTSLPTAGHWKPYTASPKTVSSSSSFPSFQPSPLNSHRSSAERGRRDMRDPDAIAVVPSPPMPGAAAAAAAHSRRRSSVLTLTGSPVTRLRMQLRPEHIIYEEVTKGQLPEIGLMKERLSRALSPLAGGPHSSDMEKEMSIRVLQSEPCYIINGTILLESRKAFWQKHSKLRELDTEAQHRSLPEISVIDPWELPIDGSTLLELGAKKGGKKTFEFPEYRLDAECKKCHAGEVDCIRCGGLDAVDCFWCGSTGYFKGRECKKCNTTGQINCIKCNNTGKLDCKSCDGKGAFKWAFCVDVKMDSLSLPSITLDDLIRPDEEGDDECSKDASFLRSRATQAIYETAQSIFTQAQDGNLGRERRVPVLASCRVEKHMKRVLHVSRWSKERHHNVEHTRFLFTTDVEERLVQLPFTMDEVESRRLQDLDAREQQRLRAKGKGLENSLPVMRSVPHSIPHLRKSSLPLNNSLTQHVYPCNEMASLHLQRGSV